MTDAPAYPGYRAEACNGCGLCCLTIPCPISYEFGLWKDGKCRALRFAAGRYWCDALLNPRRVSVKRARYSKSARVDAMGAGLGGDHRAAKSAAEALELLRRRNIVDEMEGRETDTCPRMCVVHREDGTQWVIEIPHAAAAPTIQRCVAGLPHGPIRPLSENPDG